MLVRVGDRTIRITHPEKQILPNMTKAEIIEYYYKISEKILPWLRGRPLTLLRAPEGPRKAFFQKDTKYFPDWIPRWEHDGVKYAICNDLATLVYLTELDTVEFHIPAFRAPNIDRPDYLLFDLDPHPPASWEDLVVVVRMLLRLLRKFGLKYMLKLSGKRGIHIVVPTDGNISYTVAKEAVRRTCLILKSAAPDIVAVGYREPGVFIDYNQNAWHKTMACPFSLRINGKVSLPISEGELERPPRPSPQEALCRDMPMLSKQDLSGFLQKLGLCQ